MRKISILILVLSSLVLSGCATIEALENRLAVTAAGDELLVISKYGPIGIATKISDKDRDAVKAMTQGK